MSRSKRSRAKTPRPMGDRKMPASSDPGVTMMLAGKLKAAQTENAKLRAELERLRGVLGEAVTRIPDNSYGNGLVIAEAHAALGREDDGK